MNRLELEAQIIQEGKTRGIIVTNCRIYDRGEYLHFYPQIQNNEASKWVYKYQVEDLIHDMAPIERPHKIDKIKLDNTRHDLFEVGDSIEVENLWIRLNAGEKEPEIINVGSVCGQWRSGWIIGKVFETPKQNDRALGITFTRDIWFDTRKNGYFSFVTKLEELVQSGKIKKVETGQPIWMGTSTWSIRKPQ